MITKYNLQLFSYVGMYHAQEFVSISIFEEDGNQVMAIGFVNYRYFHKLFSTYLPLHCITCQGSVRKKKQTKHYSEYCSSYHILNILSSTLYESAVVRLTLYLILLIYLDDNHDK